MKFAWLTDIHLNFIDDDKRNLFYKKIIATGCDGVLLTGDIAEAPSVNKILQEMGKSLEKPIYFVLGNHDYFKSSIHDVRQTVTKTTENNDSLFWLPASNIFYFKNTALLGIDGWADGRFGDFSNSPVRLNDSLYITDLFTQQCYGQDKLLKKMQAIADEDAKQLENKMNQINFDNVKKIIILTHVPPFKEACWHEGKISTDDYLPFFASKATGEKIQKIALKYPDHSFLVLCGHTHGTGYYQALDNLAVKTGGAEYFSPEIQELITL